MGNDNFHVGINRQKLIPVLVTLLSVITCQSTTEIEPTPPYLNLNIPQFMTNETLGPDGSGSHNNQPNPTQSTGPTKSRIVETKFGRLQGLSLSLFPFLGAKSNQNTAGPIKNKIVEAFLGIPYTSVPIRFTPPQTPIPWEGVRGADKPGPVCPQMFPDVRSDAEALKEMPRGYLDYLRRVEPFLRNQSEDCLYLNIYSPIGPDPKLKPVVVFIHGGKFAWGSGNLVDGTVLAAYGDIVFVTFNYRLGVLGFLNLNTTPGRKAEVSNYGLLDQIAAVHWIKENIMFFGGDPENITLMGYEAGAASIHFLMSSPAVMPGLFHRSVLIGASAFAPWAVVTDPNAAATMLAQNLNCSTQPLGNTSTFGNVSGSGGAVPPVQAATSSSYHHGKSTHQHPILECLKTKHFSHFSNFAPNKFSVEFGPTVDGIVIKPYFKLSKDTMGKRDLVKKYDLLFGLSSLEKMTEFSEADLTFGFEGQRRDAILRTVIRNSYRFHLNEILATVVNEYTDWERSVQHPIATRDLTLNAVTDCLSLAPVIGASESSQINKAFFYVFDHATRDGLYNYQRSGAAGGEELIYIFGSPLIELMTGQVLSFVPNPLPANFTKNEMALAELMITFISNFASTSDPNEPLKPDQTWPLSKERNRYRNNPNNIQQWEPYDRLQQKYLEITGTKIKMKSHYRSHQMAIWLRLVPELQRSGAHYASSLHNRMKGGNDPSLYVGSIRNSLIGDEEILNPQLFDLGYEAGGIGGVGGAEVGEDSEGPPSPPTTCFSPVFSAKNSTAGQNLPGSGSKDLYSSNATVFEVSNIFAPYSTALSVTIAIGCSLLILNVFIFALVYYQRDKRRAQLLKNSQSAESESRDKYSEPPELLKSNSAPTVSSIHQSNSISTCSQTGGENYGIHSCGSGGGGLAVTSSSAAQHHRGTLLSPQQAHAHMNHHQGQGQGQGHYTSASQLLGVGTLPRANNGGLGMGGLSMSTLPKPPPPPRGVSNFSTMPHKGGHVCHSQIPGSSSSQKLMPFEELNV